MKDDDAGLALAPPVPQIYSGDPKDIVTGHASFQLKPKQRTVNRRRHPRIPCRNVKAFIEKGKAGVVVDVLDISRLGLCFRTREQFDPGAKISIAPHYIEGHQNMFQDGRIAWKRGASDGSPDEYGVEFLFSPRPAS